MGSFKDSFKGPHRGSLKNSVRMRSRVNPRGRRPGHLQDLQQNRVGFDLGAKGLRAMFKLSAGTKPSHFEGPVPWSPMMKPFASPHKEGLSGDSFLLPTHTLLSSSFLRFCFRVL